MREDGWGRWMTMREAKDERRGVRIGNKRG